MWIECSNGNVINLDNIVSIDLVDDDGLASIKCYTADCENWRITQNMPIQQARQALDRIKSELPSFLTRQDYLPSMPETAIKAAKGIYL